MAIYQRIATQFAMDFHLAPCLFERLIEERDAEEITSLMERLNLIHLSKQRIAEWRRKNEQR